MSGGQPRPVFSGVIIRQQSGQSHFVESTEERFKYETHHVLLQVGLASEAETTSCAVEVSLSLIVDGASVILKGAFVAEGGSADVAVEDVTSVSS